ALFSFFFFSSRSRHTRFSRDWRSDVCSSDLRIDNLGERALARMRRTDVGFVFQAFHLMDELTAIENVELAALLAGRSPRAARRRAEELLERGGLADRARLLPSAPYGGRRARGLAARHGPPGGGPRNCWSGSGWPTGPGSFPRRSPAASGSGSRSPGP